MGSYTDILGLYKADPVADGAQYFNIDTMLNENWDKLSAFVIFEQIEAQPGVSYTSVLTKSGVYDVWTTTLKKGGQTIATCTETETATGWTTVYKFMGASGTRTVTLSERETSNGWEGSVT